MYVSWHSSIPCGFLSIRDISKSQWVYSILSLWRLHKASFIHSSAGFSATMASTTNTGIIYFFLSTFFFIEFIFYLICFPHARKLEPARNKLNKEGCSRRIPFNISTWMEDVGIQRKCFSPWNLITQRACCTATSPSERNLFRTVSLALSINTSHNNHGFISNEWMKKHRLDVIITSHDSSRDSISRRNLARVRCSLNESIFSCRLLFRLLWGCGNCVYIRQWGIFYACFGRFKLCKWKKSSNKSYY